uniref:Peroxisomal 2,4-dienoyl-CoA reductase [(3E)-enoyl-CoA-producing] n=1 Tax=Lepisosteus oculatus TaxID=7918 RepID=W5M657_LEPOC
MDEHQQVAVNPNTAEMPEDVEADECLTNYSYVYSPDLLKDRVAFVTGGGSGIGFRTAEVLMRHGCDTVIASRNQERLSEAARKLSAATGRHCLPLSLDVRQPETIAAAVDETLKELGRIDILVNNAAGNFLCPAASLSFNAFKTVMEIDTMGTFNTSKVVYDRWLKVRGPEIPKSFRVSCLSTDDHMTKMSDCWAKICTDEAGNQEVLIKHLALVPANMNYPEVGASLCGTAAQSSGVFQTVPLQRAGSKTEIAHGVLYLASRAASYVTGASLVVDGGSWLTSANSMPALLETWSSGAKQEK